MFSAMPALNAYDWIVILVLLLSMTVGLMRGMSRELASIGGWICAFLAARAGAEPVSRHFEHALENSAVRLALCFIAVFVLTLLVCGLVAQWLVSAVRKAGLRPLDRLLGALFGVVRAALIVMMLVILAGATHVNEQRDWKRAYSTAWLERMTVRGLAILPAALAQQIPLHGAAAGPQQERSQEG